jgi:hypothetical protein
VGQSEKNWNLGIAVLVCLAASWLAESATWAMGRRPGGYVPSCGSANPTCVSANYLAEDEPTTLGCRPGWLSVLGFDAQGKRTQSCLNMNTCGESSPIETHGICRDYNGNRIGYKCLKFDISNCPTR